MSLKYTNTAPVEIEDRLFNNQQAVETHISRITELQKMIEREEAELSVKITQSQDMVNKLLNKFVTEH